MYRSCISVAILVAALTEPAFADMKKAAVHVKQGAAYHQAGQYDDAIAEFKKAYELEPKPQTLFNIGNAYFKKGDYTSAVEYYQKYLDVDPDGRFSAQALEFSAIAKKTLADEEAKRKAAAAAAAAEAEKQRLAAEEEKKRVATQSHVRNAQAFGEAGAWSRAGDEYRAAFETSGDTAHLLSAADAYRKQPALEKARDTYESYLAKAPLGAESDRVRTKLAEVTALIDKQQAEQAAAASAAAPVADDVVPAGPPKISKVFAHASVFVPMRGLRGASELSSQMDGSGHWSVESGIGFEASGYYALRGMHAFGASITYTKLTLLDDAMNMPIDGVAALRAAVGYRLLSRRGRTVRPTIGLNIGYYNITVDNSMLVSDSETRGSVELELGLLVQARDNYLLHVAARLDLVPMFPSSQGIFLGGLGLGVGAHF